MGIISRNRAMAVSIAMAVAAAANVAPAKAAPFPVAPAKIFAAQSDVEMNTPCSAGGAATFGGSALPQPVSNAADIRQVKSGKRRCNIGSLILKQSVSEANPTPSPLGPG